VEASGYPDIYVYTHTHIYIYICVYIYIYTCAYVLHIYTYTYVCVNPQVEAGSKQPDAVHISLLEFNKKFEPRDASDAGITVWDFLIRFFLQVRI